MTILSKVVLPASASAATILSGLPSLTGTVGMSEVEAGPPPSLTVPDRCALDHGYGA